MPLPGHLRSMMRMARGSTGAMSSAPLVSISTVCPRSASAVMSPWTSLCILAEVERHECRLVEITGGEPPAQREGHGLINALADRGHTALIETSGALDITPVDRRAIL